MEACQFSLVRLHPWRIFYASTPQDGWQRDTSVTWLPEMNRPCCPATHNHSVRGGMISVLKKKKKRRNLLLRVWSPPWAGSIWLGNVLLAHTKAWPGVGWGEEESTVPWSLAICGLLVVIKVSNSGATWGLAKRRPKMSLPTSRWGVLHLFTYLYTLIVFAF